MSVICGVFAVATTICNITVLMVHFVNKKLINAQAVYKISLAISDFLVGVVIFPTFISSLVKSVISPLQIKYLTFVGYYKFVDEIKILNLTKNPFIPFTETLTEPTDEDKRYYNAIGVFSYLSVSVSEVTLGAAAIDRFKAIYRPLAYNPSNAISTAKKISVAIWIAMLLLSTFPVYANGYRYESYNSILIIPYGPLAPVIYPILLITFTLLMWITTISTFVVYKKTASKRKRLVANRFQSNQIKQQKRLLQTLGIMVGVFTLCLVPTVPFTLLQDPQSFQDFRSFFNSAGVVVAIVLASNSLWNFFVYNARNKDFKKTVKNLYSRLFAKLHIC